MNELRIQRRCFASTAFIFALVSITMFPIFLRAPFPHATSHFHADPAGLILIAMRELILLMPPAMALVNAAARWTVRKGHSSARQWAIASSSLFLVYSLPFFIADITLLEYHFGGAIAVIGVFLSAVCFSGLGITGLAYFTRCEALTPAPAAIRHF